MSGRTVDQRAEIVGPMVGHSMNQRKIGLERDGARRLFGETKIAQRRVDRDGRSSHPVSEYDKQAQERKNELFASIMRGFDGQATPMDRIRIREQIAEFEQPLGDGSVRLTLVEF